MLGATLCYHVDIKVFSATTPKKVISVFSKALHGYISGSSVSGDFFIAFLPSRVSSEIDAFLAVFSTFDMTQVVKICNTAEKRALKW